MSDAIFVLTDLRKIRSQFSINHQPPFVWKKSYEFSQPGLLKYITLMGRCNELVCDFFGYMCGWEQGVVLFHVLSSN